jgi:predicted Rossmann-fold nucleotide-binding protein
MPIVLFGAEYWDEVIKFDALVKYGTISPNDLELFHRTNSLDEAYEIITKSLTKNAVIAIIGVGPLLQAIRA